MHVHKIRKDTTFKKGNLMTQSQIQNNLNQSPALHNLIILAIIFLGRLMCSLDSTIVLLAFPPINDGLHFDLAISIWKILIYLIVIAVETTQIGRIGDIYGGSSPQTKPAKP